MGDTTAEDKATEDEEDGETADETAEEETAF